MLNVKDIINGSNLEQECKDAEKEKVLAARKSAFGANFNGFPPHHISQWVFTRKYSNVFHNMCTIIMSLNNKS